MPGVSKASRGVAAWVTQGLGTLGLAFWGLRETGSALLEFRFCVLRVQDSRVQGLGLSALHIGISGVRI